MWSALRIRSARGFVKDVHKAIGYRCPFNLEEQTTILSRINESQSINDLNSFVSKPRAQILFRNIKECGKIMSIESLLDFKSFDPKVIETMSKKILKIENLKKYNAVDIGSYDQGSKDMWNQFRFVYPPFRDSAQASSFVTFRIFPSSLSFVHFSRENRKVLSMENIPIKLQGFDKSFSVDVNDAYEHVRDILQKIPCASFYIHEKMAPISSRDAAIPFRVALHTVQTVFFTLLLEVKYNEMIDKKPLKIFTRQKFIYSVKPSLVNKVFSLKIGSERVAGSSKAASILRGDKSSPFYMNIEDSIWQENFAFKSSVVQEQLSQALLLTSAFHYLYEHNKTKMPNEFVKE